jgi:hypothetical protein
MIHYLPSLARTIPALCNLDDIDCRPRRARIRFRRNVNRQISDA